MAQKGRYTELPNKIGLYSTSKGSFIKNDNDVVLSFPFKDAVLEAGMSKEDVGRDERFLHQELDSKDIDTLEEPKVLTNFKLINKDGERNLTGNSDVQFFDEEGNLVQNLLIKGNNLLALHTLKQRLAGQVKLIYIDPPYNTGSDGFRYNDSFNHSAWLAFMKNRLEVAKDLLSNDGAIFVQCDDNEQAYLKVLLDEVFGMSAFRNTIAIKMSEASGVKMNHAKSRFPKIKEYLLFYTKDGFEGFRTIDKYRGTVWDNENNIFIENFTQEDRDNLLNIEGQEDITPDDVATINNILKNAKLVPLAGVMAKTGLKDNKLQEWLFDNSYRIVKTAGSSSLSNLIKTKFPTPDTAQDIRADLSKNGILFYYLTNFNRDTKQPRFQIIFADENVWKNPCDFWQDIRTTGAVANEGGVMLTNGKKPEKILERIIKMVTNEGDIVLDYHLGSGTTSAVAHKMNRRWVGVEQMDYIEDLAKTRLINVINGDQTGVSKNVGWNGGGSFVYFELKKYNQEYVERIMEATSVKELEDLYVDMRNNAFLKFWFDRAEFEKDENFRNKDLDGRKQALADILDENQLYLNYADMNDTRHTVSVDEKALTDKFYGENEN